ncbi:MAG: LysM peptidoglycan-binding domain-containing protein [Parcubacteria group bacterium]|nr:LysM peptidoglycan-binding domain-containing protein [Parcubacteria group bacterium]
MKLSLKAIKKPLKSLSNGFKKVSHFLGKVTQKSKKGFVYILKRERVENLRSIYEKLLSRQNKNSLHAGVIIVALAIGGFNIIADDEITVSAKDSSILVDLLFPEEDQYEIVKSDFDSNRKKDKNYLPMISMASAAFVSGSINNQGVMASEEVVEKESLNTLGNDTLVRRNMSETTGEVTGRTETGVLKYEIKEGDTVSSIAKKFSIDAATILEENDLYADDIIKSGMKLSILPISGATERVDAGQTLSGIAKKHDIDEDTIKKYNNLLLASDIEEGQILIIPDGNREIKERPRPEQPDTLLARGNNSSPAASTSSAGSSNPTDRSVGSRGQYSANGFPSGYCTWYVATRRGDVTWRGNAGQWLTNAQAQGRATGRVPAVGSIMVTNESWWGHVAVVTGVQGDTVYVSEMNYAGFGIESSRAVSNSSGVIKGYIY